jgi:hypothetical protein
MALTIPPPQYDAVLRFYPYRIELAFAAKVSPEITRDVEGLACPAIEVKREKGIFLPSGCMGRAIGGFEDSSDFYKKKQNEDAQEFGIDFLAVYEPRELAEAIAQGLEISHNLRIKIIDDSPPDEKELKLIKK